MEAASDKGPTLSGLGRFIQTYSSFLSSFVIGFAGLIATSIWQYKQSEIARRQAEAQQKVAETNAQNEWRIERAEILSKNLQVLASHGVDTIEQRYGVLLSLTRGDILEPELAVSYALELGRENPDYMRSVLGNIADKNYFRLLGSFDLTCQQRFGTSRDVPMCRDKNGGRADAIAELISDEAAAVLSGANGKNPFVLLKDERQVHASLAKLAALFTPFLGELYERRQWGEIEKFEAISPGAHLVSAVVLDAATASQFVSTEEAASLTQFHDRHAKFLSTYLFGPSCNPECKSRIGDVLLSSLAQAEGRYDATMQQLVARPAKEIGPALARLQMRLLGCSVSIGDLNALRDRVLVPLLKRELERSPPNAAVVEDAAGLMVLLPEPVQPEAKVALDAVMTGFRKNADLYKKAFVAPRAAAQRARLNPPPALKKVMFCNAAELEAVSSVQVDE